MKAKSANWQTRLWLGGLGLLLVVAVLVWVAAFTAPDGKLHLWMLDVGQGDALLIETPHGRTVLIDGGPDPALLRQRLGAHLPFWNKHIDLVVSTHPDLDHLGGLVELTDGYSVGAALASKYRSAANPDPEAVWYERLAERGVSVTTAQEGIDISLETGVTMRVENPAPVLLQGTPADGNNASVVLRLTYGTIDMLFTGDIEADGIAQMVRDAKDDGAKLDAEVLKVPHHGSKNGLDRELLDEVQPQVALISVGAKNTYGHPADTTLDLLKQDNVETWRTDENGTVEVITDGQRLWVAPEKMVSK